MAAGLFWLMLGVSGLFLILCLSISVVGGVSLRTDPEGSQFLPRGESADELQRADRDGIPVVSGELTIAFGAFRFPLGRDADDAVRFVQLLLAGVVADTVGILLTLVWTASFLPGFLSANTAAVLLTKPVPRWLLLFAKYLGVLAFVGFQAAMFVGATWMALVVRTGVWNADYLLCVPLLVLHFAVFYSASVMLAVSTRSSAATVFGSLCFWFLCCAVNFGHHSLLAIPEQTDVSPAFQTALEVSYWTLPKPIDFNMVLFEVLHAENHFRPIFADSGAKQPIRFHPELSMLSSFLFAVVLLAIAAHELDAKEF